jgi:hypothetical protein
MKFLGLSGVFDYAGQELALTLTLMLPSAHYKDVGVRMASFRSSIAHPAHPYLRFAESVAVAAQGSGPGGLVSESGTMRG